MALIDLIAQGGTQNASPIMRFAQGQQFKRQEEESKLKNQLAQEELKLTRDKQLADKQKRELGIIAPLLQRIKGTDDLAERESIYQAAKQVLPSLGIDVGQTPDTFAEFDQSGAPDAILGAAGIQTEGSQINILVPGVDGVQPGVVDKQGRIVHPTTRKPIPGAIKAPSQQETGEPGSLTQSQIGKEQIDFEERRIGVRNSIQDIEKVRSLVLSDEFIGGLSGDIASSANSVIQQVKQITGGASVFDDNGRLDPDKLNLSKENMSRFRRAAINDDRVDSAIMELAFVFAKELNPDGRISDADVRSAERIISQGADKASINATLSDVQERIVRRLNNRAKEKGKQGLTMEEILGKKDTPKPQTRQVGGFTIVEEN